MTKALWSSGAALQDVQALSKVWFAGEEFASEDWLPIGPNQQQHVPAETD